MGNHSPWSDENRRLKQYLWPIFALDNWALNGVQLSIKLYLKPPGEENSGVIRHARVITAAARGGPVNADRCIILGLSLCRRSGVMMMQLRTSHAVEAWLGKGQRSLADSHGCPCIMLKREGLVVNSQADRVVSTGEEWAWPTDERGVVRASAFSQGDHSCSPNGRNQ